VAVVVDASAIGAIAFGEPEGPALAAALRGETLIAPALIDYELSNLAVKKTRRSPASAPQIAMALDAALALPISRTPVPGLDAFAVAWRTGLTAYDAAYLWLAQSRDLELVTLDAELERHRPR
jgi:predicted nucleic acid-binding protein